MRCAWAPALAASALAAGPAIAQDAEFKVDLPAGGLADALRSLSAQTGASVVVDQSMPPFTARRVRGRLSVRRALERMVKGSTVQVTPIGPSVFRLSRGSSVFASSKPAPPPAPRDIVVTARKFSEVLADVPAPVVAYVPDEAAASGGARTTHDVASRLDGLTLTQLGPGRDRP